MVHLNRQRSGIEVTMVIILLGMVSAISLALLQIVVSQNTLSNREIRLQQISQIAEAGVNYYRWRLAHYPTDYQDGTGQAGPYIHDFKDGTGTTIGRYELTVTPPTNGNSIATIRSSGYTLANPNARHTITIQVGIPSLSKFAVVANADIRFGEGTETFGPVQSNGGIHFDGVAHGLVSSAKVTYTDPDGYGTKPGVWSLNPESSTFLGGKQVGVPPIDFAGITVNLATLQAAAQSNGIYLAPSTQLGYHLTLRADGKVDMRIVNVQQLCQYRTSTTGYCSVQTGTSCTASSQCGGYCAGRHSQSCSGNTCGSRGPCILNGQTCVFDWKNYGYCSNDYSRTCTQDSTCGNGNSCVLASHSIGTAASDQSTFTYKSGSSLGVVIPSNGIIFASDNIWVDGVVNNARITIVAAKDPLASGRADIYINNDLTYTHNDGSEVIGLIAQNDILTGLFSEDDLHIDAAVIAQNGRVGRPYFGTGGAFSGSNTTNSSYFQIVPTGETNPAGGATCQEYRKRSTITLNGSLATNQRYGFAWTGSTFSCGGGDTNGSGYCTRNINFDQNLVYGPPPSFPTSGQYSVISFTEE